MADEPCECPRGTLLWSKTNAPFPLDQPEIHKICYKTLFFGSKIWRFAEKPYLCNVFFIVLDLRLTKVGIQRYPFFFAHTQTTIKKARCRTSVFLIRQRAFG